MGGTTYIAQLLVDGYNMIGAWPTLVQTKQEGGFEAARRELTEILANYSARKGLATFLVFDAYGVQSPSCQDVITANLSVHYTAFGQTADAYIEKICSQLMHRSTRNHRTIVATSDRAHQLTVVGYGAEWMSARQLERDVELSHSREGGGYAPRPRPSNRSLQRGLDAATREKLARLRFGLR
ncbi:MAG: NYN domain-containing protein [Nodosilinea sp.]